MIYYVGEGMGKKTLRPYWVRGAMSLEGDM